MYRNYVNNTLSLHEYNTLIKSTPEGLKYCNAFCQKFMDKDMFYETKALCKECFNLISKVRKMIDNNQLTAEQFRENPELVQRDKTIIPIYRECINCEERKTLDQFEPTRKECIICRKNKKKNNNMELVKQYINAIEEVKTDIVALKNLLRSMPADLVRLTVTHYQIPSSDTDRKDHFVLKIIDYFKAQLNPYICLGKCGCTLSTQFTICDICKKAPKSLAEERILEFEKNLPAIIGRMSSLTPEEGAKYNKKQIIMIARKLGVSFYQTQDKPVIIELIHKHLTQKEEPKIDPKQLPVLALKDLLIASRQEDGFINATQLCKIKNKVFNDWYKLDSTKELINELEAQLYLENPSRENPISVIDTKKAGKNQGKNQESWIHPDLGLPFAEWLDKKFAIKISRFIRAYASGTVTENLKSQPQSSE